ncbi:MAG: DUF1415 family protein [Polyangiaceae bacterium]
MKTDDCQTDWEREALRVHRRYQREVVEALGLCPWAERARVDGKVRERVLAQTDDADVAPSVAAIGELGDDPSAEVVFLVYPRLRLGRSGFDDFASRVRTADTRRHVLGNVPFVFAVFHPDAEPDTGDPERLIPFLRRTPDPTLQLVRSSALDAVRSVSSQGTQFVSIAAVEASLAGAAPLPPLRERIARANLATTTRMGIDALRRVLDDIRHDRDQAYGALGDDHGDPVS